MGAVLRPDFTAALVALWFSFPGPAEPPAEGKPADLDARVTMQSRRALSRDNELGSLNLGVRVHFGVATLWGPVPSEELAARAVRVLGKVQGVYQVRNELFSPPPLLVDVLPRPQTPAVRLSSSSDRASGVLGLPTGLPGEPQPEQVHSAHPGLTLPEELPLAVPRIPPPTDLSTAIDRLRGADPRFENLRIEVREGVVILQGRVRRGEHLMELAQAIAKLPSVRQVDVRGVMTKP